MDGQQHQTSMTNPSFKMEMAKLRCLTSSELQLQPQAPRPPITQYPSVDFSFYNSWVGNGDPSSSTPPFSLPISGTCRYKRIRTIELKNTLARMEGSQNFAPDTRSIQSPVQHVISDRKCLGGTQVVNGCRRGALEFKDDPSMLPKDKDLEDDEQVTENMSNLEDGNPCKVLGSNVFGHVLSFLDCKSLARCLAVSVDWQRCAQDDILWDPPCKELWKGKIHLHPSSLDPTTPRLKAFSISLADSKRVRIEAYDLCAFAWELRFKEHTSEYWKELDPYYRGLSLMRRIFHMDGHITAEPMDAIWGGHECSWTLRKSKARGGAPLVRINHWPPLVISRTPSWGWRMENAWVVYTSTNDKVNRNTVDSSEVQPAVPIIDTTAAPSSIPPTAPV